MVESTTINLNENVVVIRGRNFGKDRPDVRVADYILKLKSFSSDEIIASLPPGIRPVTYTLTITYAGSSESFTMTLFAAE